MSGPILFLSSEDFEIEKNPNGGPSILRHRIDGFSLVLFYSTHCSHCQTLLPIFKKLPGTINGCQFAMINVSVNKNIVQMSLDTVSPIKYVPYITLYVNGKPYMLYKGPYNEVDLRNFVVEVANNIQKKQQFSKERVKEESPNGIPAYTVGKPICGNDKVCYLTFTGAYQAKQK